MVLSALGIFMVVDSHTFTALNMFGDYIPYNSFFMPMFVFISGYFNKVDNSTKLLPYFGKKIKNLLVPFVGIAAIVYGLQQLTYVIKGVDTIPLSGWYLQYILQRVITVGAPFLIAEPMWFVISLFATLIVYAILKKFLYKIWNSYVMFVFFSALNVLVVYLAKTYDFETIEYFLVPLKVMFFLPFLELGVLYRNHLEKKHDSIPAGGKIGLMALMLIINAVRTMYLPIGYDLAFDALDELSGFTSPYLVTPLVSSIVGITFWLTSVTLIGKPVYESRFVNYMSCNTFWIMGLHVVFFNLLNCILLAIDEYVTPLLYFDVEYFQGSEWYYWEISPDFKLVYVFFGVIGPLFVKWIFDLICTPFYKLSGRKKKQQQPVQPVQPVQPIQPMQPVQPMQPMQPGQPGNPAS